MSELKFKPVPYDIVTSASTGRMTVRGTDANAPYNSNLLNRLQAIVTSSADNNMFNEDIDFGDFSLANLQELLTQVAIRFDNDPNYYTKRDYQYLIWYLCKSLKYLENNDVTKEDFNDIQKSAEELLARIEALEIETDELKDQDLKILEDIENLKNNQQVLEAGSSIEIDENNKINAIISEDIQVTIPVGGLNRTIQAGEDITAVLKELLQVVIGVKAVNPTLSLTGTNKSEEYGTSIPETKLAISLNQGYFEPADSRWNGEKQYMNCAITSVSVAGQTATVSGQTSASFTIPAQTLTSVKTYSITDNNVSANSVVPVNSSNQSISEEKGFTGGKAESSGTITFTPYYNAFMGGIDVESISELTSDNIRSVAAHQLSVTPTAKTLLNGQPTSNNAKKAILIACPSVYQLTSVQSELGTDMTDSFDLKGSVNVKCGEEIVSYNCYLCVVHGECKFQTVKLGKA